MTEAAKKCVNSIIYEYGRYDGDFLIPVCEDISKAAGGAEALKDLPRWKKWENGAYGNGRGIPLALVVRGLNGYELVDALGIQGERYIVLSDLEKTSWI